MSIENNSVVDIVEDIIYRIINNVVNELNSNSKLNDSCYSDNEMIILQSKIVFSFNFIVYKFINLDH